MKKIFILLISFSILSISCNPEEEKDFQKKEEDCGCEEDESAPED